MPSCESSLKLYAKGIWIKMENGKSVQMPRKNPPKKDGSCGAVLPLGNGETAVDCHNLAATDSDEFVGASARELVTNLDEFIIGGIGGPSISDGRERGGGFAGTGGRVDADEVTRRSAEDTSDNPVGIDGKREVVGSIRGSGPSIEVDEDTLGLVVEHEDIVVDTDEEDGGIHVGIRKGLFASQDFGLLVFDNVDGSAFVHDDEVDGVGARAELESAMREFGELGLEAPRRNDDEVNAFVVDDFEGDLLVNGSFDIQTAI